MAKRGKRKIIWRVAHPQRRYAQLGVKRGRGRDCVSGQKKGAVTIPKIEMEGSGTKRIVSLGEKKDGKEKPYLTSGLRRGGGGKKKRSKK